MSRNALSVVLIMAGCLLLALSAYSIIQKFSGPDPLGALIMSGGILVIIGVSLDSLDRKGL